MKKLLFALMGICALALTSCSSDDNNNSEMSNRWSIDEVTQTLYDNDTEGVSVTVRLAQTPKTNIVLEPVLTFSDDELSEVFTTTSFITIPAGTKNMTFKVSANGLNNITKNGTISLSFKEAAGVKAGKAVTINVAPVGGEVEELTADQEALIAAWKDAGFDATDYLGVHKVNTVIYFNDDDKEAYFNSNSSIEYNSYVTFNISPNATEDDICFIMKSNALGMQNFLYKMMKMNTVEDYEYWYTPDNENNQNYVTLYNQVNYDPDKETFNVSLEIHFNLDGTIAFTEVNDDEEERVAFVYDFSAWNRQQTFETFLMDNGDAGKEEISMEEAIEYGITFNPAHYLGTTDISYDVWDGGETSLYVTPEGTYTDNDIHIIFPFDFSLAWGYEKVHAWIMIHEK